MLDVEDVDGGEPGGLRVALHGGASDHREFECPERKGKVVKKKVRVDGTSESKSTRTNEKSKRQKTGWNKFVKQDDRGSDEDSDDESVHMLQEDNIAEGILMSEENDAVHPNDCLLCEISLFSRTLCILLAQFRPRELMFSLRRLAQVPTETGRIFVYATMQ